MIVVTAKLTGATIEQSELKTQEKLLEIELRLAEISEQMSKKQAE